MQTHFKTQFAAKIDRLGLRLAILLASLGWFIGLWGVRLTSLIAAAALSVMICLLLHLGQKRTTDRREEALRRRIGGEIALNEILTLPPRKAHFQAALWLCSSYPDVELLRAASHGVYCRLADETLLVSLIAIHPGEKTGCSPLLGLQRSLGEAHRAVALLTASPSREAQQWAAQAQPPIRLILPETLRQMAGRCHPATDEQLAQLGRQRRPKVNSRVWLRHILAPHRTRRYLLYGLGLGAVYFFTRLPYYPVPAVLLISLALLSKVYPHPKEPL